jgi:hypothetical protein
VEDEIWSSLGYQRLSESDLETKHKLVDRAHELRHAGVQAEIAGAAMVLSLAQLFRHRGPASDWAEAELRGRRDGVRVG